MPRRGEEDGFVALLRGVNVGSAKRLPMADLRALLIGLGYADVVTLLNSGNAVFRARGEPAALAATISAAIERRFGFDVPVVVIGSAEFDAIVRATPFDERIDPARVLVAFAQTPKVLAGLSCIGQLAVPPDAFVLGKHAAYLHCPLGSLQSPAGKALLGRAGTATTTRNWSTTLKLHARLKTLGR